MQTITFNTTSEGDNISAYIFEDGDTITSESDRIICPDLVILDMNSSNATIHTGVTPPGDWKSNRYHFDGSSWSANSDWAETVIPDDVKEITE